MIIKNKNSILKMKEAGKLLESIFLDISYILLEKKNTFEIDFWIESMIKRRGLKSKVKGYKGYKYVSCISLNDTVVHGLPSKDIIIKNGDLVKIDVCASWKDYSADMARTFVVGGNNYIDKEVINLIEVTQRSLDFGIKQAISGNKLFDISNSIQKEIEKNNYGIIREFCGHGIGKEMHEFPDIPNYGEPNKGINLYSGMTFAIEPMVTMGKEEIYIDKDGWSVKTKDKSLSAHIEDTILITDNGPEILTRSLI